jgi:hypothetical protein
MLVAALPLLCLSFRGKVACRRLWQVGLEHFPGDEEGGYGGGYGDDPYDECGSEAGSAAGPPRSICNWLKGSGDPSMGRGAAGLWVNVYDGSTPQPGKVLLFVQKAQRELPPGAEGPRGEEATGPGKGTLKVSSCQAYDYILLAALKSQVGGWVGGRPQACKNTCGAGLAADRSGVPLGATNALMVVEGEGWPLWHCFGRQLHPTAALAQPRQ